MNSDTKTGVKLILWAGLVFVCYAISILLTPPAYDKYAQMQGLTSGSVGREALTDTPLAHSIAEMKQLDRFAVREQIEDPLDHWEIFLVGDTAYHVLSLDSGERVATAVYQDSVQYEHPEDNTVWCSPIGTWRPWELTETERAIITRKELALSTLDFYVDMKGNQDSALTLADFSKSFQLTVSWALILLFALLIHGFQRLRRRRWEINQPKNDTELWIAGTHAIWGLDFAQAVHTGRKSKKDPIRIGGAPKNPEMAQITRALLNRDWALTSYAQLLETVAYMSEGEGFTDCKTQSARAWQLCRSTSLLGMAYIAGWAERDEILRRSLPICLRMQETFSSWDDLYVSFLDHYAMWCLSDDGLTDAVQTQIQHRVDLYWELKQRKYSPYHLPWNMPLKL